MPDGAGRGTLIVGIAAGFFAAAVLFAWFLFAASPYVESDIEARTQTSSAKADDPRQIIRKGLSASDYEHGREYADANEQERQRIDYELAASDLTAQWKAADSARVSAWLTGAGVALVGLTLLYTHRATSEAKRAARAAERAIDATVAVSRDESRAYVHVASAAFGGTSRRPHVTLMVTNTGSSPVRWFEVRSYTEAKAPPAEWPETTLADLPLHHSQRWGVLPNGSTIPVRLLDPNEATNIRTAIADNGGDVRFQAFGSIRYETIHGEVFVSEFAFGSHARIQLHAQPNVQGVGVQPSNQMRAMNFPIRMYQRQNAESDDK